MADDSEGTQNERHVYERTAFLAQILDWQDLGCAEMLVTDIALARQNMTWIVVKLVADADSYSIFLCGGVFSLHPIFIFYWKVALCQGNM